MINDNNDADDDEYVFLTFTKKHIHRYSAFDVNTTAVNATSKIYKNFIMKNKRRFQT